MAKAKTKTPARKASEKKTEGNDAAVFANRPRDDEERAQVRKTGVLRRGEQATALEPGQHPDRNHESNLVEVESMRFTRVVDGQRYGPFSADAPAERRRVPISLAVSMGLKQSGSKDSEKAQMIDTGTGGKRLAGHEKPVSDPDHELVSDEEKQEAAEAKGLTQEDQLARRQKHTDAVRAAYIKSGAIEGSAEERERLLNGGKKASEDSTE